MRITAKVVKTVATYAEEFTGGAFKYHGTSGDIGHGTGYFDGIKQQVWIGRNASKEAAAYYIGGMLGWARQSGTEIPEDAVKYGQAVQESYQHNAKAMASQNEGEADGKFRAVVKAES
ncbi:hypothetical protein [Streptomyces sp. NBC_01500]|uniref:hypothetical protein n=1 Tax=Streptomyces sp. NBC_01500 TaxID=2903886 RepID=UPI0022561408|nr:hypothetical protein [Streptomyces sp. NBC_01500]MCX4554155.1 hypothetical protein [Streptomyces sp. NBC_01500]